MSLARGEALVQEGVTGTPAVADVPAVVIAIAASLEERLRVARLVSAHAPVLLVSSREEAMALLAGGADPPPVVVEQHVEQPVQPTVQPTVQPPVDQPEEQPVDDLVVDSDRRVARWEGRSVPLSPLEHDLLVCLLADVGRTWTFARIHQRVWGNDHLGGRDDVQSVVKRLRRKLRALSSPYGINAVRGVGLRLVDHRFSGPRRLA